MLGRVGPSIGFLHHVAAMTMPTLSLHAAGVAEQKRRVALATLEPCAPTRVNANGVPSSPPYILFVPGQPKLLQESTVFFLETQTAVMGLLVFNNADGASEACQQVYMVGHASDAFDLAAQVIRDATQVGMHAVAGGLVR